MANLAKQEFIPLDISGKNYLLWVLDVEIHLEAMGLGNTIVNENDVSNQDRAKAMIFLRRHLDEALKIEYLTVKDPLVLWQDLKERFNHLKLVVLPKAQYDWLHLRLQDFKSVNEYNSAMFRITSQLSLCGEKITDEEMLEKTFSTFHVSNMLLQQQYREKGFKKYSELIACLLWPTSASPFPEANGAQFQNFGRGRGRGCGRDRGRDRSRFVPRHWSRICRTAEHFVDLYQASLKKKDKGVETNFIDQKNDYDNGDDADMTRLNITDFFEHPEDVNKYPIIV
ncbi:uncharacterized protein [Coffea arabica]|uniref:Retrotransposon gag domain-containing protein n=1 Tax=Coffea arabica TaxID=13443 RepID=A0ABM4UR56_COFAR